MFFLLTEWVLLKRLATDRHCQINAASVLEHKKLHSDDDSKHCVHPTCPYLLPTVAKTAARGGIKLDHDGRTTTLRHLGVDRPKSKRVEASLIMTLRA